MSAYITMTVGGLYGATFTAESDGDATDQAEASGYRVVDIVDAHVSDNGADAILVVRD